MMFGEIARARGAVQRTGRLVRQTLEGFGFVGACALELGGYGGCRWLRYPRVSAWPNVVQHDAEPQESHNRQLVVDMVRNHGNAPSQRCDRGAFYLVWKVGGITRKPLVHDPSGGSSGV